MSTAGAAKPSASTSLFTNSVSDNIRAASSPPPCVAFSWLFGTGRPSSSLDLSFLSSSSPPTLELSSSSSTSTPVPSVLTMTVALSASAAFPLSPSVLCVAFCANGAISMSSPEGAAASPSGWDSCLTKDDEASRMVSASSSFPVASVDTTAAAALSIASPASSALSGPSSSAFARLLIDAILSAESSPCCSSAAVSSFA